MALMQPGRNSSVRLSHLRELDRNGWALVWTPGPLVTVKEHDSKVDVAHRYLMEGGDSILVSFCCQTLQTNL